jgi:hypothetical protein
MEHHKHKDSRRKFFLWGISIAASVTAIKFLWPAGKKTRPVKMLSEDGKLVEVDPRFISRTGKKVSDKEVITWVKNKPTL